MMKFSAEAALRHLRLLALASCAVSLSVSSAVLLGWQFHLWRVASVSPRLIGMRPVTAVCFLLCGISLWLSRSRPEQTRVGLFFSRFFALVVALVGAATILEFAFKLDFSFEEVLFRQTLFAAHIVHPGRMSAASAAAFVFLGLALFFLNLETRNGVHPAQYFSLAVAFFSVINFLGYLYGVKELYWTFGNVPMAVHTALLFLLLSLGALAVRPDRGVLSVLTRPAVGSKMSRRVLPVAVSLTVLLGWLCLLGQRIGLYHSEFGTALLVFCNIAAFSVLIWLSARSLNSAAEVLNVAREKLTLSEAHFRQRDEQLIKESEARLAGIIGSALDAVVTVDEEQRITLFNPAAEKMFGCAAAEAMGRPFERFIPERFRPAHTRHVRAFSQTNTTRRTMGEMGTIFGLRANGEEFPIEASISQVEVDGQKLFTVILRDVTERKRSEDTLRWQASLLDQSYDGVLVWEWNGPITFWNRGAEKLYGFSRDEAIGHLSHRLLHTKVQGGMELVLKMLEQEGHWEGELGHVTRDGHQVFVESRMVLVRHDGQSYILENNRDIAERKKAEEELRRSEARYADLVENAVNGMCRTTLDGRFVYVNHALVQMLGYTSKEELLGVNLPHGIYNNPEDRELLRGMLQRSGGVESEANWKQKDGKMIRVRISGRAVRNAQGGIEGLDGIVENISERHLLEEQLRQSQKMEAVGRLAGGVAHDFNNLLGVIIGYTELLLDSNDPAKTRARAEEIRKAGQRAAALTRQLLAFSRKQMLEPKVLDLNSLIADVTKMFLRIVSEDVQIHTAMAPDLGKVKVDPGQIEQILLNLVVNARDAMPHGGKIFIETANVDLQEAYVSSHASVVSGRYVMIMVSDSGIGMDAKTQAHAFEPFFTTKKDGTGLGLATVYGAVKQSGGYVWLYSEPGRGSTFKLYFPRFDGPADTERLETALPSLRQASETILLVEDSDSLRAVAQEFLEDAGYTVVGAANGYDALRLAEQHRGPIHLLLTDVVMPEMSGSEVAIKVNEAHPETKALLMSGYAADAIVQRGVLNDGLVLLSKPFTRSSLTQKVRQVLDGEPPGQRADLHEGSLGSPAKKADAARR